MSERLLPLNRLREGAGLVDECHRVIFQRASELHLIGESPQQPRQFRQRVHTLREFSTRLRYCLERFRQVCVDEPLHHSVHTLSFVLVSVGSAVMAVPRCHELLQASRTYYRTHLFQCYHVSALHSNRGRMILDTGRRTYPVTDYKKTRRLVCRWWSWPHLLPHDLPHVILHRRRGLNWNDILLRSPIPK